MPILSNKTTHWSHMKAMLCNAVLATPALTLHICCTFKKIQKPLRFTSTEVCACATIQQQLRELIVGHMHSAHERSPAEPKPGLYVHT